MTTIKQRGFSGMNGERQREIASMGGRAQGARNNPGNFANNRERAIAAGRKGGISSQRGKQQHEPPDQNVR